MTKDEVLRMALDELANARDHIYLLPENAQALTEKEMLDSLDKTIAAVREALAEPEKTTPKWQGVQFDSALHDSQLMTQPEQEPVALETVYETIIQWDEGGGKRSRRELARRIVALYTTLPQRKPLTEKRIEELYSFWVVDCQDIVGFARAVERTVKGEV